MARHPVHPARSRRPRTGGLSAKRAEQLKPLLEAFLKAYPHHERIKHDPVEIPHRYGDPRDIEVSALICASLAYGRVDLFKPKLEWLHQKMGPSPAAYARTLTVKRAKADLEGFVYRFNLPADLAVLLLGVGQALRTHGSLEQLFLAHSSDDLQATLRGFTEELRTAVPMKEIRKALGRERGLHHLLPSPRNSGAAKRLNLYLRWMVRGPDAVDFGIWKNVPASRLLIPLDTHIARLSKYLGLTRRGDLSWRTTEEITASLRLLDPDDPVRYDFALCHYGMSGLCPVKPKRANCEGCALLGTCAVGPRVLRRVRA